MKPHVDVIAGLSLNHAQAKDFKKIAIIIAVLFCTLILAQTVPIPSIVKGASAYAPLHTVLEFASISISIMVFALCWATPQQNAKLYFVWVAAMFLVVGVLDLAHTLSYLGMPDFITANSADKAIHYWLAARFCATAGLIGAVVIPHSIATTKQTRAGILLCALALIAVVNVFVLAYPETLPVTFIPDVGLTPVKINLEYVLIASYCIASALILRRALQSQQSSHRNLFVAATTMAMSEYFFTLYGDVTDLYNLLGHVYKIIANLFICRALFVDAVQHPYFALDESRARLSATIDAMPDLLFELDIDGNYLENYATNEGQLAAPSKDLVGQNLVDVMPVGPAQICLSAIHEASENGTSTGKRICLDVPEGRRYFELSVSQSERKVNNQNVYVVLSRDITQTVLNENSLAYEARLNATMLELPKRVELLSESSFLGYAGDQAQLLTGSSGAFVTEVACKDGKSPASGYRAIRISYSGSLPDARDAQSDLADIWLEAAATAKPYIIDHGGKFPLIEQATSNRELVRVASIPVIVGGLVRMVVTVINKFEPYSERDLQSVSLLAETIWQLITRKRQETAIQRQREELDNFFESSLDLLLIATNDGIITRINQTWKTTLGYAAKDMEGRDLANFIEVDARSDFAKLLQTLKRDHILDDFEINWIDHQGNVCCLELRARIVHDQIFVSGRDISERKEQEASLHRLSLAVEQSPLPVIITDLEGNIDYANANFFEGCDFTLREVVGKHISSYLGADGPGVEVYLDMWHDLKNGRNWKGALSHRRYPQDNLSGRVHASPVRGLNGEIINFLFHIEDTTEKLAASARIEQLSTSDQLTGLPNLAHLEHCFLKETAKRTAPICLMMLNLDGFRLINETLGHHAGDLLLTELANRIRENMPKRALLCRRSGDTFIAVIGEDAEEAAATKATELLACISVPARTVTPNVSISASIGIAFWPRDGKTLTDLMTHAEAAMYQVKESGRNNYRFYSAEMQRDSVLHLSRLRALRGAIDNNELSLNYQPQLDLASGNIIGAEVLLRWNNPELGPVSPAEFIPLAENNGLIIPISDWVIRTAMKQISDWRAHGVTNLVFAINLSAIQFSQPDLAETVKAIADEHKVPPHAIAFELTEAMAMQNPELALRTMESLHKAGFKLAIDDFGTGYSSMNYLKQFSVDKLKIDQSFIRELGRSGEDQAITSAIIHMSKGLGLNTIAEGVETQEQLDFLKQSGCSEIQGYLYSKPLDVDAFLAFLRDHPTL